MLHALHEDCRSPAFHHVARAPSPSRSDTACLPGLPTPFHAHHQVRPPVQDACTSFAMPGLRPPAKGHQPAFHRKREGKMSSKCRQFSAKFQHAFTRPSQKRYCRCTCFIVSLHTTTCMLFFFATKSFDCLSSRLLMSLYSFSFSRPGTAPDASTRPVLFLSVRHTACSVPEAIICGTGIQPACPYSCLPRCLSAPGSARRSP